MVHPEFLISIDYLGFDLQPNRIIFLILVPVLYLSIVAPKHALRSQQKLNHLGLHGFEKWLLILVISALFSLIINSQQVGYRQTLVNITQIFTYLLVYFSSKRFINRNDFIILSKVIVGFAALSSIVGIIQFFVDPGFFRIGTSLRAFSSFTRSNGFFSSEYNQGLFLTLSMIIALGILKNKFLKFLLLGILSIGVFLTMHRLSWAVFVLIAGVILILSINGSTLKIGLSLLVGAVVFSLIIFLPQSKILSQSGVERLLAERITVDNITIRLVLNEFAIDLIKKYPQGIGDIWTPLYNQEAAIFRKPIPFLGYGALSIHNGFLSAGVRYGVFGLLAFAIFYLNALFFFIRNKINREIMFFIPILCISAMLLFNTTQDYSFLGSQLNIFFALLLGSFTSIVNKNFTWNGDKTRSSSDSKQKWLNAN